MTQDNTPHPWNWFRDKVLPSIFTAVSIAVLAASWQTYTTVNSLTMQFETTAARIEKLENRLDHLQRTTVTQDQLLETLERVEQQLEIMMLRAGMQSKVKLGNKGSQEDKGDY